MQKEHASDGSWFTLSRNDTAVLSVDATGGLHVESSPLHVASVLRATEGKLQLEGRGGVTMQSLETVRINEVDGQGRWSMQSALIHTGDTVEWSWTNYHNVIETDRGGGVKSSGISSGLPKLRDSFAHTFKSSGVYYFKSQTQYSMICTIDVRESFSLRSGTLSLGGSLEVGGDLEVGGTVRAGVSSNGTVMIGGDLEVGGNVRATGFSLEGTPALGFENELRIFLASSCPTGWVEAIELGGYFLMGRAPGGQVKVTKNRPMNANETGGCTRPFGKARVPHALTPLDRAQMHVEKYPISVSINLTALPITIGTACATHNGRPPNTWLLLENTIRSHPSYFASAHEYGPNQCN